MAFGLSLAKLTERAAWRALRGAIFQPRVAESELQTQLTQLKSRMPAPVFWLLGKAQAGKTSVVRALTGRSDAEIGNGFQACTRTARFYDFPEPQAAFLRFLDTRGVGEADYDPAEDLAWCAGHAHLLIAVVKAGDHQLEPVLNAARAVRKAQPNWPLIVAQTCLHELYPTQTFEHLAPYPYASDPLPPAIPRDLARSLLQQREAFAGLRAQFVAVDFTQPDDGYTPQDYGMEALWDAIETALPLGLRALAQTREHRGELSDAYARQAHPHIVAYTLSAGAAGALPVPAASLSMVLVVQAKLFHSLAAIYGQQLTTQRFSEFAGSLGLGYAAVGLGGRELLKLIPGYGQTAGAAMAGVYAAAVTYALGKTLGAYFDAVNHGAMPPPEAFRRLYRDELLAGRALVQHRLMPPVLPAPPAAQSPTDHTWR